MSVRLASSFRRSDTRRAALAAAAGVAVFSLSWALVHAHVFTRHEIVDTPLYAEYGKAIAAGAVPYRDFALEYPPGALPVFALPALASGGSYRHAFELLMLVVGLATVVLVAVTLGALGATAARITAAVGLVAFAPLVLGPVVLTRFDLWPAALATGALAALAAGRPRLGLGCLAFAVAAKVYPLVLLPLALGHVRARRGGKETIVVLGVFVAVLAAIFLPFAVLSPAGLAHSIESQTGRPLQIESLGSAVLLAAYQLGAYSPTVIWSFGSQNLYGGLPDAIASAQTILSAAAVVTVWLLFARRAGDREALVAAAAAAVTAVVAFSKVLSPQFLIWLVPLVVLVRGRAGLAAGGLLVAALAATQAWFPRRYWDVVALRPVGWVVLVRDLLLVALFATLVVAIRRVRERTRTT